VLFAPEFSIAYGFGADKFVQINLGGGDHMRFFKKRVVYTCMFGYSEPFSDFSIDLGWNTDAICFTDDKSLRSSSWQFRYVDPSEHGPVRTSKKVKILAHRFVGEYDESLYIDNRVELKVPARQVFAYLRKDKQAMLTFPNPYRKCLYAEGQTIIDNGIDNAETVRKQVERYRAFGYPDDAGLIAGTMMLRRHNDPHTRSVMEQWFEEVRTGSYRDQVSFNFIAWKNGFSTGQFDGAVTDNHLMLWHRPAKNRLPRAFCDERYLSLNPDVDMNYWESARKHYVMVGAAEGRPWR
jgi:hypothetical protein